MPKKISAKTRKLLRSIPGYDPFEQAGKCWFDEDAANLAVRWIQEYCTFSQGFKGGKKFDLETWQQSIVMNLFGWKRKDHSRRYRECMIFVPRKNGKSELAAALINFVLFTDDEPGAQLFSAAAKRDQTKYVFDPVKKMIRNNESLSRMAEIRRNSVMVKDRSYRTMSSEAHSEHGGSTHLAVIDELHAQPNRELVDVIQTSMGERRQPLLIYTTTSDFDREGSICNQIHDYAEKVRDGVVNDSSFLPVIYQADREDDWTDPQIWKEANPNLGVSVSLDFITAQCRRAVEEKSFENVFKRLHLNVRTEQAYRWIPMVDWDNCDEEIIPEQLIGKPCYAGLDLASVNDMTAFVLVFPIGDSFHVLPYFWVPEETAAIRERRDRQPYLSWSDQGFVTLTPGNTIDDGFVRKQIKELGEKYEIQEIAYDPWNATTIARQLSEEDGFELVQFRQGTVSMNEPCKFLLRKVMERKLIHGGHPVLRWNASNVSVTADASDNIRPDKNKSCEKIDGIVALVMALGRSMSSDQKQSVYEERGMVLL